MNLGYLAAFTFFINVPGILAGYSMTYQNQLEHCFNLKFGWDTKELANFYQAWIGASLVLGMSLGALSGGLFMKIGRRNTMFIATVIGISGIVITSFLNLPCLLVGRYLFGYSVGIYTATIPRFIEETVPNHYFDRI